MEGNRRRGARHRFFFFAGPSFLQCSARPLVAAIKKQLDVRLPMRPAASKSAVWVGWDRAQAHWSPLFASENPDERWIGSRFLLEDSAPCGASHASRFYGHHARPAVMPAARFSVFHSFRTPVVELIDWNVSWRPAHPIYIVTKGEIIF